MFELTPFERRNHLAGYNPFRELENLEKEFFGHTDLAEFKTDIRDTGSAFELKADLPGFKKEDIHVDLDGRSLIIQAERHTESEEKDSHGNFIRQERSYGAFSRSFDISNVKTEEITAEYKDGVLKLILPKQDRTPPASRRLEIQ
jgi:HSP20 family protein